MFEENFIECHEKVQMAQYVREYFRQQPTRHTVRSLFLTENTARVYSFDSNGILSLDTINVHERPFEFFGCLRQLALSGASTQHDWNHQLNVYQDGQLWLPTMYYNEPLKVCSNGPLYSSDDIMGRHTICWKLQTQTGDLNTLLKISSSHQNIDTNMFPERFFLEMLKDVPGVGRMYGHTEQDIALPMGKTWTPSAALLQPPTRPMEYNVRNHVAMEFYKRSILDFNDRSELLHVLRDAIITHWILWTKGIWHHDIRPDTVRIANPGEYRANNRDVLVGFSRSKFVNIFAGGEAGFKWDHAERDKDIFKSRCRPMRLAPWLGYLQDLESFLLVLVTICWSFTGPHNSIFNNPTQLRMPWSEWNTPDYMAAAQHKNMVMLAAKNLFPGFVSSYFGGAFVTLIGEWQDLLDEAFKPVHKREPCAGGQMMIDLMGQRYTAVLAIIDKALVAIQDGGAAQNNPEQSMILLDDLMDFQGLE